MPETGTKEEKSRSAGERLDRAIDETRDTVGKAVGSARERVHSAVDDARHGLDTVRDGFEALKDKKAGDLIEEGLELVKNHPGAAVMGSLGVGFLMGLLFGRRN